MWWLDGAAGHRSGTGVQQVRSGGVLRVVRLVAIGLGVALGACQVHPLYMPDSTVVGGMPVNELFRSVSIAGAPEELTFLLYGGEKPLPPKYYLRVIYTEFQSDLGIQQFSYVPQAELVSGKATYTLSEVGTNKLIDQGGSSATATYEIASQSFSNLNAKSDASTRVNKMIAADLRLKVTTALLDFVKSKATSAQGAPANGGGQGQ